MSKIRTSTSRSAGQTLVELLAVVAIVGLAVVAAALYLHPFEASVESGANQLAGMIRLARSRAMATTSSYRIFPASPTSIRSEYADGCGATTWIADDDLDLDLPREVSTPDTSWSICFNPRGISSDNVTILLAHADYGTEQVEVLLGGAVRVDP